MTDLVENDITGKTMSKGTSWRIQVTSPERIIKEFDCSWTEIKPLMEKGNIPKIAWKKLEKDAAGRWFKTNVPAPTE